MSAAHLPDELVPVRSYYGAPAVRARIEEYCGGAAGGAPTCWGLASFGGLCAKAEPDGAPIPARLADLASILDEAADVCRSLADLAGTVVALDLDYANPGNPGEPYLDPKGVFARLEPVHKAVLDSFRRYGLTPRVLITGRGYHYAIRAPDGSPFQAALAEAGVLSEAMRSRRAPPGIGDSRGRLLARAHDGAGRLLEHLAHRVLHALEGRIDLPMALADLPPPGGGPFACLDLSAYGDPLWTRYSRCAFSTHQKARMQQVAGAPLVFLVIPREDEPLADLLRIRQDFEAAADLAARSSASIPDVADARDWTEQYRTGSLGRFHAEFDRGPELERELWPFTYDRLARPGLPGCLLHPLASPNPFLLRPACLRTVALSLWALGWHPRSIAGLVRSCFEKDYGWRPPFSKYDPGTRAAFYVRLLCGALRDGLEDPGAFDCQGQAARGLCDPASCSAEGQRLFAGLAPALGNRVGKEEAGGAP